jgi:hypothetical protein
MLERAIEEYKQHNKHPATSIDEVLESGFAPVRETSKNLLTGSPYHFDGSANDILVKQSATGLIVVPIDNKGKSPTIQGFW